MSRVPNTETVRHLCHFHGGSKYYLLPGSEAKAPILVTDVSDITFLTTELKNWCGMDIEVFDIKDISEKAVDTLKNGVALHLAHKNMTLAEE